MYLGWHVWLGASASMLLLALTVPYITSIIRSTTRPSAVSWFGWALLSSIATVAQASKGIGWSLAVPLISAITTSTIAFVTLHIGRIVWTRADRFSIALGVVAIVLWAITKEPMAAIGLVIIADLAVTTPTIVKTYQTPESEPAFLWILYVIGVVMEIVATQHLTIYGLLFPVYSALASSVIAVLALRGRLAFQSGHL